MDERVKILLPGLALVVFGYVLGGAVAQSMGGYFAHPAVVLFFTLFVLAFWGMHMRMALQPQLSGPRWLSVVWRHRASWNYRLRRMFLAAAMSLFIVGLGFAGLAGLDLLTQGVFLVLSVVVLIFEEFVVYDILFG